jgi:hypothetical protein
MMDRHLTESEINDFVDETLSDDVVSRALQHIAGCAACKNEVDAVRSVVHRVAQLPMTIQPDRDLRRDIWARIDRRPSLWEFRFPLAAAAVVLIALSSAITYFTTRNAAQEPVATVTPTHDRNPVDLVSIERQYSVEVDELQRALRENRASLSPETVRILEENISIIDNAIAEARRAIATDPASPMLGELLRSAYQRKVELLKQAARSTAAAT